MGLLNLKRSASAVNPRSAGAPVAIDFGSASLKVLQLTSDDPPALVAAGCVEVPEDIRTNIRHRLDFQIEALPKLVASLPLRGKRAVCAIPSPLTFCKHVQFPTNDAMPPEIHADAMLTEQLGRDASTLVRRLMEVPGAPQSSGNHEFICLATGREIVDKLMKSIRVAKLEPVGMRSEFEATLRAFHYVNHNPSDENRTTLYLDVGGGQTQVVIGHGSHLVFARNIGVGGISLDECLAKELGCPVEEARQTRLAMTDLTPRDTHAPAPALNDSATSDQGGVAVAPTGTSLREPLEILTDETGMCLRYHDTLFPNARVSDVVFVGGESRHRGLCQHIARAIRLPAKVADPLARITRTGDEKVVGLDTSKPMPGWTVPIGLCQCPTDL